MNPPYRRDPLGRTTEETITYGEGVEAIRRTLRHSFTPDGRRASLVYPDGAQIQYRFDQGRLQRADLPGDEAIRWTQYQWQQPGRVRCADQTFQRKRDGEKSTERTLPIGHHAV